MILIADAGATSINWRMIDAAGAISQCATKGFNPYQQDQEYFQASLVDLKAQIALPHIKDLFYYGTGVSNEENRKKVLNAIKLEIPADSYHIGHDLLAAARALLLDQAGIACILGTGTNSCYYDGKEIQKIVPSLGYALGDEGSGAALGKRLVIAYMREELPKDLVPYFTERFHLELPDLLKNVYQGETPSKYLASFSKFLIHHQKHPFIYQLIYKEFKTFFENILLNYDYAHDVSINFCGSIAFYYSNILRQVASDINLPIKTIVESPIAGLTLYHQNILI